jgi:predicted SAM-dependent methyltransferase
VREVIRRWRAGRRYRQLQARIGARPEPLRLVLGSSGVYDAGWIATDADQLNLTVPESWERLVAPSSVDAFLAEHVWEHLSISEGQAAAELCYRFLRPGGYIRVAVPDGLRPDPEYQEYIKVGGVGGGEIGGHKTVFTYLTLREIFVRAGFTVNLLEYHDEAGEEHISSWRDTEGTIHRSARFDDRGVVSIILDATKP